MNNIIGQFLFNIIVSVMLIHLVIYMRVLNKQLKENNVEIHEINKTLDSND